MPSLNRVLLIGHLGADPELKHTNGGQPVCNFNLATNERWTSKDGEKKERTEWHRISAWGKNAENVSKYVKKGSTVLVEGKLQTRTWEKNGEKRYATDIVADKVLFLDANGKGSRSTDPRHSEQTFDDSSQPTGENDDPPF